MYALGTTLESFRVSLISGYQEGTARDDQAGIVLHVQNIRILCPF